MSTSPAISTPVKQISPSPIDACMSPTANMPPGWRTGKYMRAPLPCRWSSRLPPCRPARPFDSVSPSVATPTTPTIGRAGKRTRSFISIQPSCTRKSRVTGDSTCSISWPKPGIRQAKPTSIGRTSRISATSESPGSAPLTATGPVALLTRSKSISRDEVVLRRDLPGEAVVRLEGDRRAGLDLEHRLEVGPERPDDLVTADPVVDRNGHLRRRGCGSRLRCHRLVLDVDALHVRSRSGIAGVQEERQHDAHADPAERDPVRILDRIRRRELVRTRSRAGRRTAPRLRPERMPCRSQLNSERRFVQ